MMNEKELFMIFHNLELDNSGLVVKKKVLKDDKMLSNYLSEKVNYIYVHYKDLSSEIDKQIVKTKGRV